MNQQKLFLVILLSYKTNWIKYNPRSVFIMTQLGGTRADEINNILYHLSSILQPLNIRKFDATSFVTGRDFHTKQTIRQMSDKLSEIIIEAHTSMIKMSAKSWAWT